MAWKDKGIRLLPTQKGAEAMNKLNECEARLESFAQQGVATQDENKPTSGYQS